MDKGNGMTYTIEEHRHRFAVWTAARAVSRGFVGTECVERAIRSCKIREYVEAYDESPLTTDQYRDLHVEWCRRIREYWARSCGIPRGKATYGRAAKVVAVYLKTVKVIVDPWSPLSLVAHPPIDETLLVSVSNLEVWDKKKKNQLASTKWTKLKRKAYLDLVDDLRAALPIDVPFWCIESCWQPVKSTARNSRVSCI